MEIEWMQKNRPIKKIDLVDSTVKPVRRKKTMEFLE